MWQYVTPDYRLKSITELSISWLQSQGLRYLIIDVDNTLAPYGRDCIEDVKVLELIARLKKAGFHLVLVSNNGGVRLKNAVAQTGLAAVSWALKPLPWAFRRALKKLKADERSKVLVVGDQILTDVLGAHLMGLKVVLVTRLSAHEFPATGVTRCLEKGIVRYLKAQHKMPEEGLR